MRDVLQFRRPQTLSRWKVLRGDFYPISESTSMYFTPVTLLLLLQTMDTDCDGVISIEEFMERCRTVQTAVIS